MTLLAIMAAAFHWSRASWGFVLFVSLFPPLGLFVIILFVVVFSPANYRVRRARSAARRGNWAEVDRQVQAARKAHRRRPNSNALASLLNIARVYEEHFQFATAEALNLEALDLLRAQEVLNRNLLMVAYNNLGNLLSGRGEFRAALEHFQAALQTAAEIGPAGAVGRNLGLCNVAQVRMKLGQWRAARGLLEEVERSLKNDKTSAVIGCLTHVHQTELEARAGDLGTAETVGEKAASEARLLGRLGNGLHESALTALAEVRWRQGRHDDARACAAQALKLYRTSTAEESPFANMCHLVMAQTALAKGDLAEAEERFRQAWTLRERYGFPDDHCVAEHLQAFAVLLRETERLDQAEVFEQRAHRALAATRPEEISTAIEEIKTFIPPQTDAFRRDEP